MFTVLRSFHASRISGIAGSALLIIASLTMEYVPVQAQDKSVRPGVNDSFLDPNVNEFVERFEIESREVFAKRKAIVERLTIERGSTVADIGAGTGLFTRLFSDAVGAQGQVLAVRAPFWRCGPGSFAQCLKVDEQP